ncbi:MAG: 16S rRNA (uracil(1498)-N(3))-methyltransferase [Ruminococcus sp.]|nr:16S rRNA (uracil(1498)-N(3))-methyltransferase [Ruminococcus sp.]
MAWFFTQDEIQGDEYLVTGEDSRHIEKSLRMRQGEELTLVTPKGVEHTCTIQGFTQEGVCVRVTESAPCNREPEMSVTLYQSLVKGDKMDMIIQKSVELGVVRIVPVITERCVSRPDEKSLSKKRDRWQKIALGAAQQSCRGVVPCVDEAMTLTDALRDSFDNDMTLIFYEGGGESLRSLMKREVSSLGIFVGCEGGFDISEVEAAVAQGAETATLGKRILRAETAPLAALAAIMCLAGDMD